VVGEVDGRVGLAGRADAPAVRRPDELRRPAARGKCRHERLGPEVLVDVDRGRHGEVMRFSEPVQ
jgi:hypothetical protein